MRSSITSRQIAAARALLDIRQSDLAAASGVSINTIRNIEAGTVVPRASTSAALRAALELRGVCFIDDQGQVGAVVVK